MEKFTLSEQFVEEAAQLANLRDEIKGPLTEAMKIIREDRELREHLEESNRLLFHSSAGIHEVTSGWPDLQAKMGEHQGFFALFALLTGLPETVMRYRERNIPLSVLTDTLADLNIWMKRYYDDYGAWGLENLGWMVNHFRFTLFRIGRLQYAPHVFRWNIRAYRNLHNGRTAAMSEPGVRFRNDGQVDGTNGIFDPDNGWTAALRTEGGTVEGYPIHPRGFALREKLQLDGDEWELALKQGDSVLDIHIPEGEKLTYERCGDSFRQAKKFFRQYFPETDFRAFLCTTWFLDAQLQDILPSDSNIVRFQKEFYLYPILSDDSQTFERVFGGKPEQLSEAPRDTSLRRSIIDYVQSGHHVRTGSGFILMDDLRWGEAVYQKGQFMT